MPISFLSRINIFRIVAREQASIIEVGFIRQMIEESAGIRAQVAWFTTLVSSSANLPAVQRALRKVEPLDVRIVPMAQGQKQSRFVAWTFLDAAARQAFRAPAPGQGTP